jgi:hypothetical protein
MDNNRSHDDCPRTPIAASEVGAVTACPGCGVVHLQLEYLTLRFEPEAFRDLARLVNQAQRRIDPPASEATGSAYASGRRGWH